MSEEPPVERPAIKIALEMVSKAINKMKPGKAARPSGIIIEAIKATGDGVIVYLASFFNRVIVYFTSRRVLDDWHLSYIINLFKGKGDALSYGNYTSLKLQEHETKILEHILNTIIWKQVSINNMQFGFMPDRGTTHAIFIFGQLQEKYLQEKKNIYFAFVDPEKVFDCAPCRIF